MPIEILFLFLCIAIIFVILFPKEDYPMSKKAARLIISRTRCKFEFYGIGLLDDNGETIVDLSTGFYINVPKYREYIKNYVENNETADAELATLIFAALENLE